MKKLYSILAAVAVSAFSFVANAQNELVVGDVKVGDLITLSDGSQWYVGTNEITNGSFDADPAENNGNIVGWTVGTYAQMTSSNFKWFATGGYDGGAYIQAAGHTGAGGGNSIAKHWPLEKNTRYYFSFYVKNQGANNQYSPVITLTDQESTAGGQNEDKYLIGMSGNSADGALGFSTDGKGDWAQTACSFDSEEYCWLQCNARWLGSSHCYDGFFLAKLYDPSTTTQSMVAFLALQSQLSELENAAEEYADYEAVASELTDFISEGEYAGEIIIDMTEDNDLETLQGAIEAIKAKIEAASTAAANIDAFNTLYESATALIESETNYPGFDAFSKAYEQFGDYVGGGYYSLDDNISSMDYVTTAIANLKQAIADYRFSQEASEEHPADYTFYIDNPVFAAKGEWYIGESGGDQRLNTIGTKTVWNAWRNTANFTEAVIQQDLTGLPNGYYTVSADMITQTGCVHDQHVFANSSAQQKSSPVMSYAGWDINIGNGEADESYSFETLTTEKVLVVDGKLTIGAMGTGTDVAVEVKNDYRQGWFCVTNFTLNYLGAATDAEYAAAVEDAVAVAKAYADNMHFAGDKADYLEVVNATKTVDDLAALNAAKAAAENSETEYNNIMNGSYKDLKDRMAGEVEGVTYSDNAKKITQVVLDAMDAYIASADAKSANTPSMTSIQRIYRDTLIPALTAAEDKVAEVVNAEGKAALEGTIASVVADLSTYTSDEEFINSCVAALNNAVVVATASDINYSDNTDVTAYVTNPNIDSETGWTFVKVVGNTNIATGQQYDGNTAGGYIDSWNGSGGTRHTGYQVLNVPNGKYKVENIMRTSGTGAYLFASDAAPVTSEEGVVALDPAATNVISEAVVVPTPSKYYVVPEGEEANDNKTDNYGEIWVAAADKIMAQFGVASVDNENQASIYDLVLDKNNGSDECPEGVDAADWAVFSANGGKGRGWFNNSLEIEVKNHTLVIGATCDYVFVNKAEEEAFTGTWFSADNFKLTLVKAGDNSGWNPATGVETVETAAQTVAVYSIAGARVNGLQKGINIVKMSNGTVKKVLVK